MLSSRQRRLTAVALSLLMLIGVYSALPRLIALWLESRLTALGFSSAEITAGYPTWDQLRLHELRLGRRYASDSLSLRLLDMTVTYSPWALLSGRIDGVHLDQVEVQRSPALGGTPPVSTQADTFTLPMAPGQWLAALPLDELSVDALSVYWRDGDAIHVLSANGLLKDGQVRVQGQIRPANAQTVAFSARARENGEVHLALRPSQSQAALLELDNRFSPLKEGALRVEGSLQARLEPLAALLGPWLGWTDALGKLEGNLASRWQGELATAPGAPGGLRISSEHHLAVQAARLGDALEQARVRLDMTGVLTDNRLQWRIGKQSSASVRLTGKGPDTQEKTPLAIGFPQGLDGHAELAADGLTLTVLAGSSVRLAPLQAGGLSLGEMQIELAEAATLRHEPQSARWSWTPLRLALSGLALGWADGAAQTGPIRLAVDELSLGADGWKAQGKAALEGVQPVFRGQSLPVAALDIPFRLEGERVEADPRLAMGQGKIVLSGRAHHDLGNGLGQARFELAPVVFAEPGDTLSHLVKPWQPPLELRAGSITGYGRLDWREPTGTQDLVLEGQTRLHGNDLAGHYQAIAFQELRGELTLSRSEREGLRTSEPARLRIGRIDLGFPVTDLRMTAEIALPPGRDTPVADLHELSLDLLGGMAQAGATHWDFAEPVHPLTITLQGLSLGEIVALEKRDDLQAKGTLDGRLPVQISKAGIAMRGGKLHAVAPGGVIRYRPSAEGQALAKDNPGMNILLQALRNLHYQVLKVNADSTLNGDLTLQVALRGRNPDWQAGRPVHLNLKLEENIPKLLRSLRLADDIETRVQQHYRRKP